MNWIFNTQALNQNFSMSNNPVVSFEQKRNFSGKKGENIIFLEFKNGNWVFTKHYEIIDVVQNILYDDYLKIIISLELNKDFKENKLLDDYVYSLLRVTNFKNPKNHFKRKYSRLTDIEFDAILNDNIYTNRTILGTILNALHSDHQKSFVEFLALEEPSLLTNKPDVDKALNLLYDYCRVNIVEPIIYLKSSGELFREIFGKKELNELCFSENLEKAKVKRIKPQLELIEKYKEFLPIFQNIEKEIPLKKKRNNRAFKILFKNSRLPIYF